MKQFLKNFGALRFVKNGNNKKFTVEELESKHEETSITHYNDSIYFAGISEEGMSFVTRMSFRNKKLNEREQKRPCRNCCSQSAIFMVTIQWGIENQTKKLDVSNQCIRDLQGNPTRSGSLVRKRNQLVAVSSDEVSVTSRWESWCESYSLLEFGILTCWDPEFVLRADSL